MKKSSKHFDESLSREEREWTAFALKRSPSGGWDSVELNLPKKVVEKYKEKSWTGDILDIVANRFFSGVARAAHK